MGTENAQQTPPPDLIDLKKLISTERQTDRLSTPETEEQLRRIVTDYWEKAQSWYRYQSPMTEFYLNMVARDVGQYFPLRAEAEQSSGVGPLPKQLSDRARLMAEGRPANDRLVAAMVDCKFTTAIMGMVLEMIRSRENEPTFDVFFWTTAEMNPSQHVSLIVEELTSRADGMQLAYIVSFLLSPNEYKVPESSCEVRIVTPGERSTITMGRTRLLPINWEGLRLLDQKFQNHQIMTMNDKR